MPVGFIPVDWNRPALIYPPAETFFNTTDVFFSTGCTLGKFKFLVFQQPFFQTAADYHVFLSRLPDSLRRITVPHDAADGFIYSFSAE
jgi:hypothetical protein